MKSNAEINDDLTKIRIYFVKREYKNSLLTTVYVTVYYQEKRSAYIFEFVYFLSDRNGEWVSTKESKLESFMY